MREDGGERTHWGFGMSASEARAGTPPREPEWWSDSDVSSGSEDDCGSELAVTRKQSNSHETIASSASSPEPDAAKGITVNVHINGLCKISVDCGRGDQSLKWLCLAAIQRYRKSLTSSGRMRHCEPLSKRASSTPGAVHVHHLGGCAGG